jgi:hypothetical protein
MAKKASSKKEGEQESEPEYASSTAPTIVNPVVGEMPAEIITEEKAFLTWIYQRLEALGDSPDKHEHMQTLGKLIEGK